MAALLFGASCGVAFIGVLFAGSMGRAIDKNDSATATGALVLSLVAIASALMLALAAGLYFGGK